MVLFYRVMIFFYQIMGERVGYSERKEDDHKSKISCKGNEGIYFGEVFNWRVYMVVSYLSDIHFERFSAGDTTESRLSMIFFTWCIVKLYCYVTLFSACHILIVANDISHLGIKMISWRCVVGDVTKPPDFSDHIHVNCLFFTREKYVSLKTTQSSKSAFLITGDQMY